jgi:hypothetical protein
MDGTIEQISTKGQTKTPDFRLPSSMASALPSQRLRARRRRHERRRRAQAVDVTLGKSKFVARA